MAEASCESQPDYALSESSPQLAGLHPSLLAAKDVSCARASPTQVLDVLCGPPHLGCRMQVSHVFFVPEVSVPTLRASPAVDTAAYSSLSHDESDTAFCLLDQNLKSHPLWTSTPPLTERLSSRFTARSLSVHAMVWSDRTHHL